MPTEARQGVLRIGADRYSIQARKMEMCIKGLIKGKKGGWGMTTIGIRYQRDE